MLLVLLSTTLGCLTCDVRTLPGSGSLQDGIDKASDGDVLKICPGTYTGVFTIDRELTLQASDDNGEVWLDGDGQGPVVTITDAHVTLDGVGIEDAGTNADGVGGGLWIDQDDSLSLPYVSLHNVTIRDGADSGIVMTGGTLVGVDVRLQDNRAEVGGALRVLAGEVSLDETLIASNDAELGGGIYVDDGGDVTLSRSRICGNRATNGGGAWLVAGNDEEEPGKISSIRSDWCEGEDDNAPDDVATVDDSYLFGDAVDFLLSGPDD